jgi:hypothetical protein
MLHHSRKNPQSLLLGCAVKPDSPAFSQGKNPLEGIGTFPEARGSRVVKFQKKVFHPHVHEDDKIGGAQAGIKPDDAH